MVVVQELQAVLLAAGKGTRLTELTNHLPKCLLPIGNRPMIWYSICTLKKIGFREILVVVPSVNEHQIQSALTGENHIPDIELRFIPITTQRAQSVSSMSESDIDEGDLGTADTIRCIKDRITTDFLVVSCDLILHQVETLHHLINHHRVHRSTVTALILARESNPAVMVPGRPSKERLERDVIAFDDSDDPSSKVRRFAIAGAEADYDKSVPYQKCFRERCSQFTIHINYLDAHLYIFSKAVVDHLVENEYITSLKGELLPSLVRKQFRNYTKLAQQHEAGDYMDQGEERGLDAKNPIPKIPALISGTLKSDELTQLLGKLEPPLSKKHLNRKYVYPSSVIKCFAYVINEEEDGLCLRANNLNSYMEANKQATNIIPSLTGAQPGSPVNVEVDENGRPKSHIGNDCIIGSGVTIGTKVTVKRSHIGSRCRIEDGARITNSVIMEDVTIEAGAQINNSIVCKGARVGRQAQLTLCIVASGQKVKPEDTVANEAIMDMEEYIEI